MAKSGNDVHEVTGGVSIKLERKPLSWLVPYAKNPRVIDDAVPLVEESIRQVGYITPIVADEDGVILAGHTRKEALERLGAKECDVIVVYGATEEQKKKYRLLDNKTGEIATWDKVLLREELADVDFQGFDFGQPIQTETFSQIEMHEQNEAREKTVVCPRCGAEVPA